MDYSYKWASPDRYKLLKDYAKKNRMNPTLAESVLWTQLKGKSLGVKFQRQHVICDYIADFVCIDKMLIIEVDGGYHFQKDQIKKDTDRSEVLESLGFSILRFTNDDVLFCTDNTINIIKQFINKY